VVFGAVANDAVAALQDINGREQVVLVALAIAVLLLGLWPAPLIDVMRASIENLVLNVVTSKLP
jgi:NADH-quinone oxidoreductase subunit M